MQQYSQGEGKMEKTHTPGPWSVNRDLNGARRRVISRDWQVVAIVNKDEDHKIIAACPDLLEALQSIVECCIEDHSARDYASRQAEILSIARNALSKVINTQGEAK